MEIVILLSILLLGYFVLKEIKSIRSNQEKIMLQLNKLQVSLKREKLEEDN